MNKFAIQCQVDSDEALRYNREVKPRVFMGIEVDKLEFYRQVHADNPGVGVVWRHWPNRSWADDPERQALEAVAHIGGRIGHLLGEGLIRWITCNNEYIMADAPPELVEKADRYIAAFIKAARAELGVGTCWGNFNTGHWGGGPTGGQEIIDAFPRALAAAQEDGDSPIAFHEYNWPLIQDDGHWTCGKILRAMPAIVEKYPNVGCMITEFGVDDGGDPHRGWRLTYDDYDKSVRMFCEGLYWYDREVVQNAPWLVAVVIFGCGMPHWASFDIAGENRIFEAVKLLGGPDCEPPPPDDDNGGDDMDIRVVDLQYKERDFEYVKQKYGVAFRRTVVQPGQKVYRLVELWEKTGHSSLITQVLDEDGQPMEKVDVAFWWKDAPYPPDPPTEGYVDDWADRFVHGPTNADGNVGPGMGPGAYHGEGEGGPHAVWVRDPDIPSDICEKLGMLAGTNHDHLDQKFQLMTEGEGPGPGGKVLKLKERLVFDHDANMVGIAIDDDYAVEQDARGDFRGPGVDVPPIHPVEWIHPDGTRMALMEGCGSFNGGKGEVRTYLIQVRNLKTSGWLTEEQWEIFASLETGEDLKRVVYVYELVEKPEPEPPPTDGNAKAVAKATAEFARTIAAGFALFAAEMDGLAGE